MTLNLTMENMREELRPRITVFGVGGAGGNAVNNMIEQQLEGVEFVVANTDAQALQQSKSASRIQMGVKVTEGLGAGARPAVGAAAAEESIEEIVDHLAGAHMCFITAGMGGGTGTGAGPIIAQAARELGVLTVGVVTKPFQFEGAKRMRQAEEGIEALQKVVDTLIIIPNQNLFRLANEHTTFTEAFAMADDVLYQGVKGVTDLMVRPGLINLDFADVRAVMDEMGKAMMGTGEAEGDNRAVEAAEKAIANPLLDEISLQGAKGVLINITGGYDLTLFELDEAANIIREKVDPDANIIVGSTLDAGMDGRLRVSVVATGIDVNQASMPETPIARRPLAQPLPTPAGNDRIAENVTAQGAPAATPVTAAQDRSEEIPVAAGGFDAAAWHAGANEQAPEAVASSAPAPAYQPAATASGAAPAFSAGAGDFVAPKPKTPGQPSPETIARLRNAVARNPAHHQQAASFAPVAEQPMAAHDQNMQAGIAGHKPRFGGIGTLINRMAGHGEAPQTPQGQRSQPRVTAYEEEADQHAEQDRIEIPAFLRRQAN